MTSNGDSLLNYILEMKLFLMSLEVDTQEYLSWDLYNLQTFPPPAPHFQLIMHMPAFHVVPTDTGLLDLSGSRAALA